jgi:hypothetical protein
MRWLDGSVGARLAVLMVRLGKTVNELGQASMELLRTVFDDIAGESVKSSTYGHAAPMDWAPNAAHGSAPSEVPTSQPQEPFEVSRRRAQVLLSNNLSQLCHASGQFSDADITRVLSVTSAILDPTRALDPWYVGYYQRELAEVAQTVSPLSDEVRAGVAAHCQALSNTLACNYSSDL